MTEVKIKTFTITYKGFASKLDDEIELWSMGNDVKIVSLQTQVCNYNNFDTQYTDLIYTITYIEVQKKELLIESKK